MMRRDYRVALGIWIAGMTLCAALVARTGLSTDMSAFLPRSPSAAQQVLVDQVRTGVISRLVLLGIEGAPPETLALLSKAVAGRLRGEQPFLAVNNGEDVGFEKERDLFWRYRY